MKPFCFGCLIPLVTIFLLGMVLVRRVYTPADVELGLKHLEDVKRFNAVFPNHFERISGMGLFFGNESWISYAVVHDRYLVSMGHKIRIRCLGMGRWRLSRISPVYVNIREAHDDPDFDGSGPITQRSKGRHFDEFPEMQCPGDLFRILGIELVEDRPVEGFDQWARRDG